MLICTAITFVAVYRGTGTQLRHQIDQEMAGDASELSHVLSSNDHSPRGLAQAATSYVRAQPFSASSTLLFAIVPGAGTSTNRPELFDDRAAPDDGETLTEQAQENRLSKQLLRVHDGYSTLRLPDIGDLRVLKYKLSIRGDRSKIGAHLPSARDRRRG